MTRTIKDIDAAIALTREHDYLHALTRFTDIYGTKEAPPIQNPKGQAGFPGFDGMSAAVSLSYVAAMQEHGIPVTYAYISDAHDNHKPPGSGAFGCFSGITASAGGVVEAGLTMRNLPARHCDI